MTFYTIVPVDEIQNTLSLYETLFNDGAIEFTEYIESLKQFTEYANHCIDMFGDVID